MIQEFCNQTLTPAIAKLLRICVKVWQAISGGAQEGASARRRDGASWFGRNRGALAAVACMGLAVPLWTVRGEGTNTPAATNYEAFRLIVDRNIFNPNRSPGGRTAPPPSSTRPAAKVDSFGLRGTFSYEKGRYAFFDGSSSDYRKVVEPSGSIAGFKVKEIGFDAVKLEPAGGTNNAVMTMPVGAEMKREDGGRWTLSAAPEPVESSASTSSSSAPGGTAKEGGSGDEDSEILKRLMQKREQEIKK